MAEEKAGNASVEKGTPPALALEKAAREDEAEVVSVELPAPAGWVKKFMLNEDGSPRRNEIVFISPIGEEIKNKRQLQQYLKSNPGGPPSSEFDWGTGDTPRRSARIRERAKTVETPEDEKPKKRERKSSSKKSAKEMKDDGDAVDETSEPKQDATTEEAAKPPADAEMKEAEDIGEVKDKSVIEEGSGDQDAANEGEGGVQEKLDANLENAKPADEPEKPSTGQENKEGETPSENGVREDGDVAVLKDVPPVNCNDGPHLPKASPVNC